MIKTSMIRRVTANFLEFDMSNLFYPRPLLDEMADADLGDYDEMPQLTLRERPYGNPPLLINPKNKEEFFKKLDEEPLEGKLVEVEAAERQQPLLIRPDYRGDFLKRLEEGSVEKTAADSENLQDFSMPSEMLKHQEKPHPRVLLDDFYEMSRPGDQAGGEDLKEYWDRGWDNTDSPEMSEDKWLRMWTIPGENNYHQARKIVASYLAPDNQKAVRVIVGFLSDLNQPFENIRTAKLMSDLEKSTIHGKNPLNSGEVSVRLWRAEPRVGRWTFKTSSPGPTPPGYEKPYTTTFEFIPKGNIKDLDRLDVRVRCTCPSWVFWGAQYHARMEDYLYGPVRPVFAPPKKRDPYGSFLACKHVLKCIELVQNYKLPGMSAEIKKRIQKTPKIVFDVKSPEEVVKIPKDLMKVFKRPKMQQLMQIWEQSPRKRKSLLQGLSDPEEVALIAFKFPSTATALVADRLKQLAKSPELREEASQLLDEVEGLTGPEPLKEVAIPLQLKPLESDEVFQGSIRNLGDKSDNQKTRVVNTITDPDKLGFVAHKFNHDQAILSSAFHKLEIMAKTSQDPEEKKKAEYWVKVIIGGPA